MSPNHIVATRVGAKQHTLGGLPDKTVGKDGFY